MPLLRAHPKVIVAAAALFALALIGAGPAKRGNVSAYVRFEIANPVTSYDTLDAHPPAPDPERMLRTEAVRMIDDEALEAASKEILGQGVQPPPIDELRAMLRAEVVPGTYFVDLVASASTESDALAIVAAASTNYANRFFDHRDKVLRDRIQQVETVIRDCKRDIEQIESRCFALMAKEKLTRLSQSSEDSRSIETRLLVEKVVEAGLEREKHVRSGVLPEELAVQDQVTTEMEERLLILSYRLESETQALHMLQTFSSDRDAKARTIADLQRDVCRLRLQHASHDSAYPTIRALNKPRVRAASGK